MYRENGKEIYAIWKKHARVSFSKTMKMIKIARVRRTSAI